jgi:hypothetical protein
MGWNVHLFTRELSTSRFNLVHRPANVPNSDNHEYAFNSRIAPGGLTGNPAVESARLLGISRGDYDVLAHVLAHLLHLPAKGLENRSSLRAHDRRLLCQTGRFEFDIEVSILHSGREFLRHRVVHEPGHRNRSAVVLDMLPCTSEPWKNRVSPGRILTG